VALALTAAAGFAADYPVPKEGDWAVRDFRFHTGDVLPELRLHYTTVGAPTGEPVLILHGTAGCGASMLTPGVRRRALSVPGSRWMRAAIT
jgi:homoserine O-acetyltransferase/O-succinyltransferase